MEHRGSLSRRIQRVSARFLEDESLYSYLTDQENQLLVAWALEEIERCLRPEEPIRDDDAALQAAGPCLSNVRHTMRQIGQVVSEKDGLGVGVFAAHLQGLTGDRDTAQSLAGAKQSLTDREIVQAILDALRRGRAGRE